MATVERVRKLMNRLHHMRVVVMGLRQTLSGKCTTHHLTHSCWGTLHGKQKIFSTFTKINLVDATTRGECVIYVPL